jgi:ribonuclease VapC
VASVVLDASALLAFVGGEPGAEKVATVIGDSVISAVNFAEAITTLVTRGASLDIAREALAVVDLDIIDFDRALAEQTGALVARTRLHGLSLGDRACLALAARERIPALTGDRNWQGLDLAIEVRLFR